VRIRAKRPANPVFIAVCGRSSSCVVIAGSALEASALPAELRPREA
jgi:hypothetical protein